MAAADIRRLAAAFEFGLHALQRGNPRAKQARIVAGAEEAFGAVEEAAVMLAPFHAFAAAEILHGALAHMKQVLHDQ